MCFYQNLIKMDHVANYDLMIVKQIIFNVFTHMHCETVGLRKIIFPRRKLLLISSSGS